MNAEKILKSLQELRSLRMFPNDEAVMLAILRLVGSMCHSDEQVYWLVRRMTSGIYSEWPGIAEMRACFCCRYPPRDGVKAYSSMYLEGLPPDPEAPPRPAIFGGPTVALPPGHVATADPVFEREIRKLAATKNIDARRNR